MSAAAAPASALPPPPPAAQPLMQGYAKRTALITAVFAGLAAAHSGAMASALVLTTGNCSQPWCETLAHLHVIMAFCMLCVDAEELLEGVAERFRRLGRNCRTAKDNISDANAESVNIGGPSIQLTQQQTEDLKDVDKTESDIIELMNLLEEGANDGFTSFLGISRALAILIARVQDAMAQSARSSSAAKPSSGRGGGGASRKASQCLLEEANTDEAAFCPRKTPLPHAIAYAVTALTTRMPMGLVESVLAMLGYRGSELKRKTTGLAVTAELFRNEPAAVAAAAAAAAAAAVVENNSISKVLKNKNLIIDATELGKSNTKSASCAVQLATPAMDAIDCVRLMKGPLGSLEFTMKPGCWLDLKIAILDKDKGWRWFPTRLTSLELLDSAYDGGLRGRFPSVLKMAAALEDFKMGVIAIDSLGAITALRFVDAESGAAAPPAVPPPPPSIGAAAAGPSSSGGSTGYGLPRGSSIAAELAALGLAAVRKGSIRAGQATAATSFAAALPPPTPLPPLVDAAAAASGSTSGVGTRTMGSSGGGASGSSNGGGSRDTCSSSGGGASGSRSSHGGSSSGAPLMRVPNMDPTLAEIMPVDAAAAAAAPSGGGGMLEVDVAFLEGRLKGRHARLMAVAGISHHFDGGMVTGYATIASEEVVAFTVAAIDS